MDNKINLVNQAVQAVENSNFIENINNNIQQLSERPVGSNPNGNKYYISSTATAGVYEAKQDFSTLNPQTISITMSTTYQTVFEAETDIINLSSFASGEWTSDIDYTDFENDFDVKLSIYDNTTLLGFIEKNIVKNGNTIALSKTFESLSFTSGNKLKFKLEVKSSQHNGTIKFYTNNNTANLHIHTTIFEPDYYNKTQTDILLQGKADLAGVGNDTVAFFDNTGKLQGSPITVNELAELSGIAGNIQTQLNGKQAKFIEVANQSAMLALTNIAVGQVVIRADDNYFQYYLKQLPASSLSNWQIIGKEQAPIGETVEDIITQNENISTKIDGLYAFAGVPSGSLPVGISKGDIATKTGATWTIAYTFANAPTSIFAKSDNKIYNKKVDNAGNTWSVMPEPSFYEVGSGKEYATLQSAFDKYRSDFTSGKVSVGVIECFDSLINEDTTIENDVQNLLIQGSGTNGRANTQILKITNKGHRITFKNLQIQDYIIDSSGTLTENGVANVGRGKHIMDGVIITTSFSVLNINNFLTIDSCDFGNKTISVANHTGTPTSINITNSQNGILNLGDNRICIKTFSPGIAEGTISATAMLLNVDKKTPIAYSLIRDYTKLGLSIPIAKDTVMINDETTGGLKTVKCKTAYVVPATLITGTAIDLTKYDIETDTDIKSNNVIGNDLAKQYVEEQPRIETLFKEVAIWNNIGTLLAFTNEIAKDNFRIKLTANITITSQITFGKDGYIDLNGFEINTAQDGTAPVVMFKINSNVYIRNGIIKHLKTTNTSVEYAVDATDGGFYADSTVSIHFVEFAVKFEKGFIGCKFIYSVSGTALNNTRVIHITGSTGDMIIDKATFETQPAVSGTRFTNAILFNPTRWLQDSTLAIRNCTCGTNIRQFFISESAAITNIRLVIYNNDFDDLNGGIFTNYANPLDKFELIAIINNRQGASAVGNYKGLFYFTASSGSGMSIGTKIKPIFYNNTITAGSLRTGFTSLMTDGSAVFAFDTARFADPITRYDNATLTQLSDSLAISEQKTQEYLLKKQDIIYTYTKQTSIEMNAITGMIANETCFVKAEGKVYQYSGTTWLQIGGSGVGDSVPIGFLDMLLSNTIPDGWLLCDGSTFNATIYPDLQTFLGSTTLPDLRGVFLRGAGTTTANGLVNGTNYNATTVGAFQGDMFGSHTHTTRVSHVDYVQTGGGSFAVKANSGDFTNGDLSGSVVGTGGLETRPKNIGVNYIIKAKRIATATVTATDNTFVSVGTGNRVAKYNAAGTQLIDSVITETGGNVGIGTTAPTATLHVNGSGAKMRWQDNTNAITLQNVNTKPAIVVDSGATLQKFGIAESAGIGNWFGDAAAGDVIFRAINGRLLLGNNISQSSILMDGNNVRIGGAQNINFGIGDWTILVSDNTNFHFLKNGALLSYISSNGTYVVHSDRSLKENIKPIQGGLDFINKLKPVTYNYKADKTNKKAFGLIAQDVQEVNRDLVEKVNGKLSLAYTDFVPFLIDATQELAKKIEMLEIQVKTTATENEMLKTSNIKLQEEITLLKEQLIK